MKDGGPPAVTFHLLRRGAESIAVAPAYRDRVEAVLDALDGRRGVGEVRGGRGGIAWPVADLGEGCRVVVRHFSRGGLLARLLADRYWGRPRPLQEFVATARAYALGLPVPEPVAARVCRLFAGFHRGDLVTREIPEADDLGRVFREDWAGFPYARRAPVLTALGRAVRALHDAGLFHADLNLRNVLLRWEAGRPTIYFVDLDRARFFLCRELTFRRRRANLWRLARSAEKLSPPGLAVSRPERLRLLRAYAAGDPELTRRLRRSFRLIPAAGPARRIFWSLAGAR